MTQFGKRAVLCLLALWMLAVQGAAASPSELVAVGQTVGIELQTGEVTVVGFSETIHAAEAAGLKKGDVLETINGTPITAADQIAPLLDRQPARITVLRGGRQQQYLLTPEAADGSWRMGVLVQDTMTGIGTITYYDPQTGEYGALGHGVTRQNGGEPVAMTGGQVVRSSVVEVRKSQQGKPGSLRGALERERLGSVERNTAAGIFGVMAPTADWTKLCPVAEAADVTAGEAVIRANISGSRTEEFAVTIEQIDPADEQGRNLLLHVTDTRLLAKTGGIVQGMSGSPVIQNGKLVGAVTHVLVDDPSRGYGILIGNMLAAAG